MAENSKIPWTDHTFNGWLGCQKVSTGCSKCYAETWAKRTGAVSWGPGTDRRLTGDDNWRKPLRWDRQAAQSEQPTRVFTASLSDVFDDAAPQEWRNQLWELIRQTPNLDWLVLTKRPQNMADMLPRAWWANHATPLPYWEKPGPYPNVWLGVSAENQEELERRTPILIDTPATLRFLSVEPMLEAMDLRTYLHGIQWVICGGESGPGRRPFDHDWARSLRDQCQQAGVPFFFKQGSHLKPDNDHLLDGMVHREIPLRTSASDPSPA